MSQDADDDVSETSGGDLRDLLGMSEVRAPGALVEGQIIEDIYRVGEELGAGGMGRVYRAHDLRLERDVAIKLHGAAYVGDDDSLRKEGVALAKLTHPNVVAVYGVGTWAGRPWVAMEYVPGGTARSWVRADKRTPAEIVALYLAAGRGLAAAHAAGLVHRDFKPDNVLVGADGRARVADFGLARELGRASGDESASKGVGGSKRVGGDGETSGGRGGTSSAGASTSDRSERDGGGLNPAEEALGTAKTVDARSEPDGSAATPNLRLAGRKLDGPKVVAVGSNTTVQAGPDGISWGHTSTGAIIGTPAYMAPEQRRGGRVDARADQYAFAVSLWEALEGKRPFAGRTEAELATAAASGQIAAPTKLARHVEAALRRALAVAPADRWPTMDALLDELARDPARRRRRIVLATATLGLIAGLGWLAWVRGQSGPEPCRGSETALATVWGGERRTAALAHLASLTSPYAQQAIAPITKALDDYAAKWVELHHGSCLAHESGELSPELFDRRSGCLAVRKSALATVGELTAGVSAAQFADLVVAVGGLPDLAACENDAALLSPVAPPSPAQATEAAAIAAQIARVDVERDAASTDAATRDADDALIRAKALGYSPLVARALLARGRIEQAVWRGDRGAEAFTTATRLALTAGDEPLAVEAYARAAWATGTTDTSAKATDGLALIEAITERIGERAPFPRALLHNNLGGLALTHGDRATAREAFERARREAAGLTGSAAIELTIVLMNLELVLDDPAARAAAGADHVAQCTRLVGAHHPLALHARIVAAQMLDDPAATRAALEPPCLELDALHPDHRDTISGCEFELAWLAMAAGDRDAGRKMIDRVLAMMQQPDDVRLARGYKLLADGDLPAARAAFDELQPVLASDAPWWKVVEGYDAALALALANEAAGQRGDALRHLDRAAQLLARAASSIPPGPLHRRQRTLDAVRARLR